MDMYHAYESLSPASSVRLHGRMMGGGKMKYISLVVTNSSPGLIMGSYKCSTFCGAASSL